MSLEIDLYDETEIVDEKKMELIKGTLLHAYEKLELEDDCECSITFVDNTRIQALNASYRDKNQATDVISFALEEGEQFPSISDGEKTLRLLGDIVISVPKAVEQAKEYGHTVERELGFLATHGFLHLLGYDHMTPEDEKDMFTLQEAILQSFGLKRFD